MKSDQLTLDDFRTVLTLCETRHVGRAAGDLGITQPALTARLQRIENMLEVRLFLRGRHGAQPTDAGLALAEAGRSVLEGAARAAEAARLAAQGHGQRLRVGLTQIAMHHLGVAAFSIFRASEPNVSISVREASTSELETMLEQDRLDVALLHPPLHGPGLAERHICRQAGEAMSPDNAEGEIKSASLSELGDVVAFVRAEAPVLTGQLHRAAEQAGTQLRMTHEANTILGSMMLSAAGYGTALVPAGFPAFFGLEHRSLLQDVPGLDTVVAWRSLDRRAVLSSFVSAAVQAAPAEGVNHPPQTMKRTGAP